MLRDIQSRSSPDANTEYLLNTYANNRYNDTGLKFDDFQAFEVTNNHIMASKKVTEERLANLSSSAVDVKEFVNMLNAVDFSDKGNIEALEAIFSVSPKSSKYFKFDEYTGVLQEITTYLSRDFGSDLVKGLFQVVNQKVRLWKSL